MASGVLQRTTWADAGRRKTFHYRQPHCVPPSQIMFVVGGCSFCLRLPW